MMRQKTPGSRHCESPESEYLFRHSFPKAELFANENSIQEVAGTVHFLRGKLGSTPASETTAGRACPRKNGSPTRLVMLRVLNIHASSPTDLAGLLFDLPGLDPVLVCLSFISELVTTNPTLALPNTGRGLSRESESLLDR